MNYPEILDAIKQKKYLLNSIKQVQMISADLAADKTTQQVCHKEAKILPIQEPVIIHKEEKKEKNYENSTLEASNKALMFCAACNNYIKEEDQAKFPCAKKCVYCTE